MHITANIVLSAENMAKARRTLGMPAVPRPNEPGRGDGALLNISRRVRTSSEFSDHDDGTSYALTDPHLPNTKAIFVPSGDMHTRLRAPKQRKGIGMRMLADSCQVEVLKTFAM